MVQASLSAEIQAAFSKLSVAQLVLTEGQLALAKDIRSLHKQLGGGSNHLQPPDSCTPTSTSTSTSLSNPSQIQPGQIVTVNSSSMSSFFLLTQTLAMDGPLIHILPSIPVHPNILLASGALHVGDGLMLTCTHAPHSSPSPGSVMRHAKSWSNVHTCRSAGELGLTPGLVIPKLPINLPDGMPTPKSQSWKDLVQHWTDVHMPLKDWPWEHYNGQNWCFNEKFVQCRTIAMEFLNE